MLWRKSSKIQKETRGTPNEGARPMLEATIVIGKSLIDIYARIRHNPIRDNIGSTRLCFQHSWKKRIE
jgi:hypothetical protein